MSTAETTFGVPSSIFATVLMSTSMSMSTDYSVLDYCTVIYVFPDASTVCL